MNFTAKIKIESVCGIYDLSLTFTQVSELRKSCHVISLKYLLS